MAGSNFSAAQRFSAAFSAAYLPLKNLPRVGQHLEKSQVVILDFVYFVEEIENDRVKIGFSAEPWKRLSSLRSSSGADLRMLWLFEGTRATEEYFHWLFQNHRIHGEWFSLRAVIEGFKYYGINPDDFPDPRELRATEKKERALERRKAWERRMRKKLSRKIEAKEAKSAKIESKSRKSRRRILSSSEYLRKLFWG